MRNILSIVSVLTIIGTTYLAFEGIRRITYHVAFKDLVEATIQEMK